jgi:hypothetical protein
VRARCELKPQPLEIGMGHHGIPRAGMRILEFEGVLGRQRIARTAEPDSGAGHSAEALPERVEVTASHWPMA